MNIEKERMEERKWEDDVTVVRDDVTVVSSVFVLIRRSCSRELKSVFCCERLFAGAPSVVIVC